MASEHNPFRRKTASMSLSASTPLPVTTSAFLESITSGVQSDKASPAPELRTAKPKVVKRVRVLSPPPSSPSSPESVHSRGFGPRDDSSEDPSDEEDDRFSQRFPELPGGLPEAAPLRIANANNTPDNPFGKTLQNLEGLADGNTSSNGSAKPLDVNAFKMLLLTGQAGAETPPQQKSQPQADVVGTAPPPRLSGLDAFYATPDSETPRSSQDIADRGSDDNRPLLVSPLSVKKKPPPPSSRHGRKISIRTPERPSMSSETTSPISPSDINKPLPPAPTSHGGEEKEDIFAREAAGKVPEQDLTATGSVPSQAFPALGKKSMPAPPPRRGHSRNQSLTPSTAGDPQSMVGYDADTTPRSSMESQRSRAESFRSINAPAPPPPRRPLASHRQSFQLASPSSASFNFASSSPSENEIAAGAHGSAPFKISPPPPPPARNPSSRRPTSVRSFDATSRKVGGGKDKENAPPPPPPPPPRQRGSSRGSMDGYGGVRRPSLDSVRAFSTRVPEETGTEEGTESTFVADMGKGADILADLDALQREVDALRAQQAK